VNNELDKIIVEYFSYDAESGIILWKKNPGKRNLLNKEAGSLRPDGYRHIAINGKCVLSHRVAWFLHYNCWPEKYIDHIDGNKINNNIKNLREADVFENAYNSLTPKNNTSGVKNVYWNKQKSKWMARINLKGKCKFIGLFDDLDLAELAVMEAREKLHGKYFNHGWSK